MSVSEFKSLLAHSRYFLIGFGTRHFREVDAVPQKKVDRLFNLVSF